jgi:hypothetical protein
VALKDTQEGRDAARMLAAAPENLARLRAEMEAARLAALPATDEKPAHDGATWYAASPRGAVWLVKWDEGRGTVSAWQSGTRYVAPRFRGTATDISEARREAARIAALIAAGQKRED